MVRTEPPRSGLELRWRMFGVRFRVMPAFWVITAVISYVLFAHLFGRNTTALVIGMAIDVGCYFAALVVMELVQGLVYRSYGIPCTAVIQDFSSTIHADGVPPGRLQRITVALSQPASAWLMFALVHYSNQAYDWRDTSIYAKIAYEMLWLATLFWGVIGLLPIYPYSGGVVLMEVLTAVSARGGLVLTLLISIGVALAYIAYTVLFMLGRVPVLRFDFGLRVPPSIIASVFFALTVLTNGQLLKGALARRRGYHDPVDDDYDHAPWER